MNSEPRCVGMPKETAKNIDKVSAGQVSSGQNPMNPGISGCDSESSESGQSVGKHESSYETVQVNSSEPTETPTTQEQIAAHLKALEMTAEMQRKAQTEHSSKLATDRVNGTNQTGFGLLELKSGYRFIRRGVYGTAAIHDYLNEVKPEKYGLEREWIVKAVAGDETVFNAIYDAARKAIGSSQNPKMPQSVVNFFLALGAEIAGRYERGPSAAYRAFMDAGLKIETSEIEQAVRKAAKIAVVIDKRAKKPNLSGTSIASEISVHKSKVLEYLSDPDVKATIRDLSEGIGTLPKPHVDADSNE